MDPMPYASMEHTECDIIVKRELAERHGDEYIEMSDDEVKKYYEKIVKKI